MTRRARRRRERERRRKQSNKKQPKQIFYRLTVKNLQQPLAPCFGREKFVNFQF